MLFLKGNLPLLVPLNITSFYLTTVNIFPLKLLLINLIMMRLGVFLFCFLCLGSVEILGSVDLYLSSYA